MIHYTGWYFCFKSNWDGKNFDVRNLVSIDEENAKNLIIKVPLAPSTKNNFAHYFKKLKPEVFKWLEENVKNQNKLKGWCCGNDEYNQGYGDFSLFFYRRKDAINFIKTWSIYKKPTQTYNQNTYVHKILCLKTNKLKIKV